MKKRDMAAVCAAAALLLLAVPSAFALDGSDTDAYSQSMEASSSAASYETPAEFDKTEGYASEADFNASDTSAENGFTANDSGAQGGYIDAQPLIPGETRIKTQLDAVGADELLEELPDDAKNLMEGAGITEIDYKQLLTLSPSQFFGSVWELVIQRLRAPLTVFASVLGTVLLCALRLFKNLPVGRLAFDSIHSGFGRLYRGGGRFSDYRLHHNDSGRYSRLFKFYPFIYTNFFIDRHGGRSGGHSDDLYGLSVCRVPGGQPDCRQYAGAFDGNLFGVLHCRQPRAGN